MRRIRLKRSICKQAGKRSVTIGVMGAGHGVGTTHFAVMLANYYANGCGVNTCLVRYGDGKDYMRMCREIEQESSSSCPVSTDGFTYSGVRFCVCDNTRGLSDCLLEGYGVVIIDMSSDGETSLSEFKRCDVRLLVGSTDMWRVGIMRKLLSDVSDILSGVMMLSGNPRVLRELEKEYKVGILKIPTEPSPLAMQSQTMYAIGQIMKTVAGNYISQMS